MVMELLFWFAVYCPCHHNPPCFFCGCCGTECSSAVNANIPVSTSSGCLYSQGIDDNEVTFAFPLEDPQMQNKEPNISKPTSDVGCQVNTRGLQLMMKSSETQTYRSSFEVILCDQSTQTDESFHEEVVISRSPEEEPPQEEITTEIPSPSKDPSLYVPSKHDELSDDSNNLESQSNFHYFFGTIILQNY